MKKKNNYKYLIEVDGGDEYFIENIEPVRRLEPGEEILFTGPTVKYIKYRLAQMNRWDILDVVELRIRSNEMTENYKVADRKLMDYKKIYEGPIKYTKCDWCGKKYQ